MHRVLRVRGDWYLARCHARKAQYAHQSLHPLAVDRVPDPAQVLQDRAAAVKWMPDVFRVNQSPQYHFLLVQCGGWVWRRARDRVTPVSAQCRVRGSGSWGLTQPVRTATGLAQTFLSQSSSLLSRPISE